MWRAKRQSVSRLLLRKLSSPRHISIQLRYAHPSKQQRHVNWWEGLYYFAAHRSLWKPLTSRLASTLTLSVGVTTFMFVFAYLPQAAIMAFTSGPLAAVSAALLTLSESSTIVNLISRTFMIQDALIDTFDGTLVSKECTNLVSDSRQVKAGRDPIARLGKLITRPFEKFTPSAIIRYFLYLPLNFIPVVGTIVFVILQGKRNGPAAHARYFQLKGWSKSQREAFLEKNKGAYTSYVYRLLKQDETNADHMADSVSWPSCWRWSHSSILRSHSATL
jgi:Etoposide-induced protein 2.4 (EI24)